jgi:uncharacterized protein YkwD
LLKDFAEQGGTRVHMTSNPSLCVVVVMAALTVSCSSLERSSPNNPPAPSNPEAPPTASTNLESELTFCVTETNRYRATLGRAALTRSSALEAYAAVGAREDGLAHAGHQHFRSTNGGGIASAENEVPWWTSSNSVHGVVQQGLALMWAEGPGGAHYENMRGPFTQLGCGVFVNGNEITVVQDFR